MSQTFVLIVGAWHGGWAWHAVATELRAQGHEVHAPTLPGLGEHDDPRTLTLDDCIGFVVDYIRDHSLTDIVLVGHSWGGFVVSGVTKILGPAVIARRVYYSAFVPLSGEALVDIVPPDYTGLFGQLAEMSGNNSVAMPLPVFQGAFIQDASEETQAIVHAALVPQPYNYFTDSLDLDGLEDMGVPSSYVISPDDVALPPGEFAWTPRFPARLKDPLMVTTIGSHESLFTQPAAVAAALQEAAPRA
ncbi:MAG: hypothetical protein B7Y93_00795 [Micrococcales bacterium 32-70-13]|nr:MAG: hypothetical protein B7Y93_00795 [Micrococcales bacterium 32-70-13]